MLYKPTLKINRLIAKCGSKTAYDELFHDGLNILSGRNEGGKTSVIQLLTYGLGYEVKNWRDEAKTCDVIYIELSINGQPPLSIRRLNNEKDKQGMDICFKPLTKALETSIEEWKNHPYSVNSSRTSFSQEIFSMLGLPEVRVDDNNNVTLHQILRLLYSDQSNPSSCIFNIEQFDSAFKREAIGRYLMGLYDNSVYDNKILLSQQEKELDKIIANINAIHSVIGKTSYAKELSTIEQQKEHLATSIIEATEKISKIKENELISYSTEKSTASNFATEIVKLKSKIFEIQQSIDSIIYEIQDSTDFTKELQDKLDSINESISTEKIFKKVNFLVCPSCLVDIREHKDNCCDLCGTENPSNNRETNILRMKNEIEIQLRESLKILKNKNTKLIELESRKKQENSNLRQLITKSSLVVKSINSKIEKEYFSFYKFIGEAEEKITNLDRMSELHSELQNLSNKRIQLQNNVTTLSEKISLNQYSMKNRETEVNKIISKHLIDFVIRDIQKEGDYDNGIVVDYDFAANRISINSKTSFAESTAVYLNNAFHLALLFASLEDDKIRLPRLMILDGIENGGMEDARSQNLQKIISSKVSDSQVKCQIIIATKSIDPTLNNPEFVVGKTFRKDSKSLNV